jgi:predicted histidine transporter YuiF (NhaC family)
LFVDNLVIALIITATAMCLIVVVVVLLFCRFVKYNEPQKVQHKQTNKHTNEETNKKTKQLCFNKRAMAFISLTIKP